MRSIALALLGMTMLVSCTSGSKVIEPSSSPSPVTPTPVRWSVYALNPFKGYAVIEYPSGMCDITNVTEQKAGMRFMVGVEHLGVRPGCLGGHVLVKQKVELPGINACTPHMLVDASTGKAARVPQRHGRFMVSYGCAPSS